MIDGRIGIYGYPIEIQALFFFAPRWAQQILKEDTDSSKLIIRMERRITALSYHIRNYYRLDSTQLNIYRCKTEEYSHTKVNNGANDDYYGLGGGTLGIPDRRDAIEDCIPRFGRIWGEHYHRM